MGTRTEKDLLGQREVPSDAYWGVHTLRAIENFPISGRTTSVAIPGLIRAFAMVKKAAALANAELGVLPADKTSAIVHACDELLAGRYTDQFPIDVYQGGAGTSMNMNANEVIANIALEHLGLPKGQYDVIHPNDHVNMSQSTNDTYPTSIHLAVYLAAETMWADHAVLLQQALEAKGRQFARVLKMGRTQLQDAVPMTVGQEFGAFASLLAEERGQLSAQTAPLLEVNLGATAIGTGITAPAGYAAAAVAHLAKVTGLPVTASPNLISATSDTSAFVSASSALKRLAVKLSKISNDLRLLGSGPRAGLGELRLPERQAGSSIMPAKVNPVIPEVVNQVCFTVIGNDLAVTLAAEAGQLQLNAMEPVIAWSLLESIGLLSTAMDTLRVNCIDGVEVNAEVTEGYVHNSIGIVTYLVPVLGHAVCDEIGKECATTGKSVRQVVLERQLLTQAEVDDLLGFDAMVVG